MAEILGSMQAVQEKQRAILAVFKRGRAATKIQRAWKSYLARKASAEKPSKKAADKDGKGKGGDKDKKGKAAAADAKAKPKAKK